MIIGASFIGMEVASALASGRNASVSVVAPEPVPFDRILGLEIGRMFQTLHESKGITFYLGNGVTALSGDNGAVSKVQLKNGETLDADFVVVGVGVAPATEFLADSGLARDEKDGSLRVDTSLRTSHPDVYAAGDIARYGEGAGTRIEHWRVAQQHGIVAAHNMMGQAEEVTAHVPFFWTTQWGVTVSYVGHTTEWDEIIYRGSVDERKFLAFYVKGGQLKAAAGSERDQDLDAIELILQHHLPLSVEQMRDEAFSLVDLARQ